MWFAEFEQDSQISKSFGAGSGFKNFGTGAESENVTPATSAAKASLRSQGDRSTGNTGLE